MNLVGLLWTSWRREGSEDQPSSLTPLRMPKERQWQKGILPLVVPLVQLHDFG